MKDINNVLDNEYMTDEYLDEEIIADNIDPNDAARIAHDVWNAVLDHYVDTGNIGDSIWSAVLTQLNEDVKDEDVKIEVREILWEEYVPEWENYL